MPPRIVQVVLAAGRSERMGSPKPLLDFAGRTALRVVVDAARSAGVSEAIVVVGLETGEAVRSRGLGDGAPAVRWVENRERGSEQLRSLQLALEAARERALDGFFIHPADFPLSTAEDYRLLLGAFGGPPGADVFIPSHGGRRGHPILCRSPVADDILALGPGATAREAIERRRIAHVVTPNAGVRVDIDTPGDYLRALAEFRGRGEGPVGPCAVPSGVTGPAP